MKYRVITDTRFQIDALDGLRGFAALIVVASHTSNMHLYFLPFLDMRGTGKSGVYLFFLLSAYLLSKPLLEKGRDIFSMKVMARYWQRRFFRIFPLYTLYLLAGLTTTWLISSQLVPGWKALPFELTGGQFLSHFFLQEGYGVTWSVAVEFKFYFLLPFLIFLLNAVLSKGKHAAALFFVILILGSQVISPQAESMTNDASLLPYLSIFFMGVGLALIQKMIDRDYRDSLSCKRALTVLGYVGALGIVAMVPSVHSLFGDSVSNDHFHREFLLYGFFWSLILLSVVNNDGLINRVFKLPILRFCGALSFSLYLFHPVVLELVQTLALNAYFKAWLVLLLSIGAAYCSYRIIEEPLSRIGLK